MSVEPAEDRAEAVGGAEPDAVGGGPEAAASAPEASAPAASAPESSAADAPEAVAADVQETAPRRELTEISSRNVLVAVDGTPEAWDAVGLGVQIVRASHGRLTLLTVVVPPPAWTQVGLFAPPADGDAERAAEERLRELADAIPADIPVTTQLLHGDAAHLIAKHAEAGNHDLVVLAAHEHGPIGAAIESVQRRLLKCTRVPVLAIRRPHPADEPRQQ